MKGKRLLVIGVCLILVLAALPFMVACAPKEVTPTPPEEGPVTPPPAAVAPPAVAPILIKWIDGVGAESPRARAVEWSLKEIERRTEGRVKFEIYWSGALVGLTKLAEGIRTGVADGGSPVPSYEPEACPLVTLWDQCLFLTPYDDLAAMKGFIDTYEQSPLLQGEFKRRVDSVMLSNGFLDTYCLFSNKPVHIPADMEGMKVRCAGKAQPRLCQAWGATPCPISILEAYESAQRGITDAELLGFSIILGYRLHEVLSYGCLNDLGSGCSDLNVIRNDVWNKISKDDQDIIMEVFREDFPDKIIELYAECRATLTQECKQLGVELYTPSEEEMHLWHAEREMILDAWVGDMLKLGYAEKDVREYMELSESNYLKYMK